MGESESDLAGCLLPFLMGDDSVCLLLDGATELLSCDCERLDCAEVALELAALLLLTVALSSAG